MNNQATALLGLLTETSLHAGAGNSASGVDLPIQRESHNGWPCVFGSAVKGALRDKAESTLTNKNDVLAVFGPETANASDNAGAIAVGDARLLLLPVRSLTSAFKWVTCAEALGRLDRDAKRMGMTNFFFGVLEDVADEEALAVTGTNDLFLEEYRFTLKKEAEKVGKYATAIARLMERDKAEHELKKRLVIVSDDMFAHLTQAAVPINAHIALVSATKTTQDGALWYEETLPPETLLYVPLMANRSRKDGNDLNSEQVRKTVTGLFADKPWLQLGGNETVGMGWSAIKVLDGGV